MLEIKDETKMELKKTASLVNAQEKAFFLLDSETGNQYNLTQMEYDILMKTKEGMSFGEICNSIKAEYDVDFDELRSDLMAYFYNLVNETILKIIN